MDGDPLTILKKKKKARKDFIGFTNSTRKTERVGTESKQKR